MVVTTGSSSSVSMAVVKGGGAGGAAGSSLEDDILIAVESVLGSTCDEDPGVEDSSSFFEAMMIYRSSWQLCKSFPLITLTHTRH